MGLRARRGIVVTVVILGVKNRKFAYRRVTVPSGNRAVE